MAGKAEDTMSGLTKAEQLLYSTVRLETTGLHGGSYGTGFFYAIHFQQGSVHILVTNKHVIKDCTTMRLRCHLAGLPGRPSGLHHDVHINLSSGGIVEHPDSNIDLCAISMSQIDETTFQGKKVFYVVIDRSSIPSKHEWDNFDAYEEVLMVGCPDGLFDEANNLPILRRGITSSHPSMPYNGGDDFLIDAACFPGSSGSPVFLFDTASHLDKASGNVVLGRRSIRLLGVLYAGPTVNQVGEIVLSKTLPVSVSAMMHLGLVLKSSRLLELEEELARQVGKQLA